jgi:hypothetical protein
MTTQRSLSGVTDAGRSADRRNRPGPCTCNMDIGRVHPATGFADRQAVRGSSGNPASPHSRRRNSRSSTNSSRTGSCLRGRIPARGRCSAGSTRDAADNCCYRRNYRSHPDRRPRGTGPARRQGLSRSRQTTGKPDRSQVQRSIFDSWFAVSPKIPLLWPGGSEDASVARHPGLLSAKRPSRRDKSSIGPRPVRSSKFIELAETLQTR